MSRNLYVQVEVGLREQPDVKALAVLLRGHVPWAEAMGREPFRTYVAGLLATFWGHLLSTRLTLRGEERQIPPSLDTYAPEALAAAVGWPGDPAALCDAIRELFCHADGTVKGWAERYGRLETLRIAEATRKRMSRGQAASHADIAAGDDVTRTEPMSRGHEGSHADMADVRGTPMSRGHAQSHADMADVTRTGGKSSKRTTTASADADAAPEAAAAAGTFTPVYPLDTHPHLRGFPAPKLPAAMALRWADLVSEIPEPLTLPLARYLRASRSPDLLVIHLLGLADGARGETATPEGIGRAFRDMAMADIVNLTTRMVDRFVATADRDLDAERIEREKQIAAEWSGTAEGTSLAHEFTPSARDARKPVTETPGRYRGRLTGTGAPPVALADILPALGVGYVS